MLALVRIWILISSLLVGSGWLLSALHQLNWAGYAVMFVLAAATAFFWLPKGCVSSWKNLSPWFYRTGRRFQKPAPFFFLLLALMSFAGGALYVSTDGDGLAYRTPRVLHWLAQGQWHWIHAFDYRMNIANCGIEWLFAPVILFTHTDRFLFLINVVSYFMLPGLIFSVLIRLGVRRLVAWWWMWLLASGWCYVMQAGSLHNDGFAVIYALAAVDLALRAGEKNSWADLCLSLLSVALLTGVKQTNLPLALLWGIAAWPARRLFFQRPFASLAAGLLALLVSALPVMILNLRHAGTWAGIPETARAELHSPFWGIVGNLFCLPVQNLMPPFFPWADSWNAAMHSFLNTPFGAHFSAFEDFAHLRRSISDETAGIGCGICLLILLSLIVAVLPGWRHRGVTAIAVKKPAGYVKLLHLAPWFLLLVYMAKVGTKENGRQLAPYYVFFFPWLLALPVHAALLKRRGWRCLGLLVMIVTCLLVFMSRSRPMFPAQTLLAELKTRWPQSVLLTKVAPAYDFRNSFESLRNIFAGSLPPDAAVIGYFTTFGNAEPGLSLPLGRRRVERFLPTDSPQQVRLAGIRFVVVDDVALRSLQETADQWAGRYGGTVIDQLTFYYPYQSPDRVYLIELQPLPITAAVIKNRAS